MRTRSSRPWLQTSRRTLLRVLRREQKRQALPARSNTPHRAPRPCRLLLQRTCGICVRVRAAPAPRASGNSMNINVNSLASPSRGRLFYGRYRSQRAEESRRRQLQLAAIGVACVVAALLSFSLCVYPALCSGACALTLASRMTQDCASLWQPPSQLVLPACADGLRARRRHCGWACKHNACLPRGACAPGCEVRGGGRVAHARRYACCAAHAAAADNFRRRV